MQVIDAHALLIALPLSSESGPKDLSGALSEMSERKVLAGAGLLAPTSVLFLMHDKLSCRSAAPEMPRKDRRSVLFQSRNAGRKCFGENAYPLHQRILD